MKQPILINRKQYKDFQQIIITKYVNPNTLDINVKICINLKKSILIL